MPYMKYGDWYIPNCNICFPTETEAWEYINLNSRQITPLLKYNRVYENRQVVCVRQLAFLIKGGCKNVSYKMDRWQRK